MRGGDFLSRKGYRRFLLVFFVFSLLFAVFFVRYLFDKEIPDEVKVFYGEDVVIKSELPISYSVSEKDKEVSVLNTKSKENYYYVQTKLFGVIPAKKVKVQVLENVKLIPCGCQIGIYLHTKGVLVIDTDEVMDINGNMVSPAKNIVMPDDYIIALNDIAVSTKSQLIFLINKYGKDDIVLKVRRNNEIICVKVKPVSTGVNEYKAGIWVRDDSQGIGTLTYIDENGNFGALGHGINDIDTGKLLDSKNGILYSANIWGINKGEEGTPGGLLGSIEYEKDNELGEITTNTDCGIFGIGNSVLLKEYSGKYESMEVCLRQDIKKGSAYIRTALNGEIKDYEIRIINVDYSNRIKNKGMEIQITDIELLKLTNGIVQGMSGSPILQNGRIVGAVTHVLVDDPTKGYGIFIENMLEY